MEYIYTFNSCESGIRAEPLKKIISTSELPQKQIKLFEREKDKLIREVSAESDNDSSMRVENSGVVDGIEVD